MAAITKAKPPTSNSPITITAIFSTRTCRGVNTVPAKGVFSGSFNTAILGTSCLSHRKLPPSSVLAPKPRRAMKECGSTGS